jgi:hypothetical protein
MTTTEPEDSGEQETVSNEEQQVEERAEAAAEEARVHQEHRNVDETRESMRTEVDEEVTPEGEQ